MTTLILGLTALAAFTTRVAPASSMRSSLKSVHDRSPLAAMSESRFVVTKKKSSRMNSSKWRAASSQVFLTKSRSAGSV